MSGTFFDLLDSVARNELILVEDGILQYYLKKNGEVTLSMIISQRPGVGQQLLSKLYEKCKGKTIWVRCPINLTHSNNWWVKRGYRFVRQETTRKGSFLNVYRYEVPDDDSNTH